MRIIELKEEERRANIRLIDIEIKEIHKNIIVTLKQLFPKLSDNAKLLTFELLKILN